MVRFHHLRVEESRFCRFAVDSRNHREYDIQQRYGVQSRRFDGTWQARTQELGGAAEAARLGFVPAGTIRREEAEPSWNWWDAGALLENHRFLLDFLGRQGFADWRCEFRSQRRRFWLINRRDELGHNRFDHDSLTVRFRPDAADPAWLEIGEGTVDGAAFNLDGLAGRIGELAASWRSRRGGDFSQPQTVVLQAGDGAIFFHEILGHALEADHVAQGRSPFGCDDIGKAILPETVSLYGRDERDRFFSGLAVDDEGEPPPAGALVENGVLNRFVSDSFHALQLGLPGIGSARAEDFSQPPLPRAEALYLRPGAHPAEELVASTRRGLLAREFGGGRAILHRGGFLFHIADARWIENGRLGAAAGPVVVSGSIRDVLGEISMVGDDFRYDRGISYCRKNGQTLNVRVGQPSVKIDRVQVTADGTPR